MWAFYQKDSLIPHLLRRRGDQLSVSKLSEWMLCLWVRLYLRREPGFRTLHGTEGPGSLLVLMVFQVPPEEDGFQASGNLFVA